MAREGSAQPALPMTLAGTPATVALWGTGFSTTEPAAIRAQWPTSILPRIFAPAPIRTPWRILGWRSPSLLAGPPERHVLEHGDIVLHDRRRADHQARGMVEEDAPPDPRRRMDVGLEHLGRAALEVEREILPVVAPQPMGEPVGLDGVEAPWKYSTGSITRLAAGSRSSTALMSAWNAAPRPRSRSTASWKVCSMMSPGSAGWPRRHATRWITAASRLGCCRTAPRTKLARAGSPCTMASPSCRSRSQRGSTVPATGSGDTCLVWGCAMMVSWRPEADKRMR